MNIFNLNTDDLDLNEAREALSGSSFDLLPGVPQFLAPGDCAYISGVSAQTIERLVLDGSIPVEKTPEGDFILRSELLKYIDKNLLANKPIL
jgi:hypothetical protein